MSDEARLDVPRNDLIRGLTPMRAEDDGNVMVGYPIVFNQWTEIDSWEGHFLERVLPSGPVKAMKEGRQRVQYNHGMHPVVGSSGLGTPRVMKRDAMGVYTETPLSDTSYNRDIIKPLLADGTLDGMSFRFSVIEDRWRQPKEPADHNPKMLPERSLVEFKWHEFGPVDWPAYEAATAGIRSQVALALWLQTPQEQRASLMRQFHVSLPEPRVIVPGWEAPTPAPTEEREQDPSAGDDATDTGDPDEGSHDSGPVDATRSMDADEAPTYQPARPPALTPERRESQRGLVRAWAALSDRSA
jgi:uncharacterized protein